MDAAETFRYELYREFEIKALKKEIIDLLKAGKFNYKNFINDLLYDFDVEEVKNMIKAGEFAEYGLSKIPA